MDNKQLLESAISATMTKEKVADIVSLSQDKQFDIVDLYGFCFHPQAATAFRAAWIMEYIALEDPDRFAPVLPVFLSELPKQHNLSCQRHFTKILMSVVDRKAPEPYRLALQAADREQIVSVVFDWLASDRTPIAVKANCMDILVCFCDEFDWMEDGLRQQISQLMFTGSPALDSRGKKVFQVLGRQKR